VLAELYTDALLEGPQDLTTLAFPALDHDPFSNSWPIIQPDNDSVTELHLTAYKVLAVFGIELRLAMTHNRPFIGDLRHKEEADDTPSRPKVMPPTAIDIPFRRLMGSVTFGPVHDTPPFFRRHLENMTSVQFIEERVNGRGSKPCLPLPYGS